MECKKCGNEIKKGEEYCRFCGLRVKNNEPIKIKFTYVVCTIIILFILVILVIMLLNNKKYENNKKATKTIDIEQQEEITNTTNTQQEETKLENTAKEILKEGDFVNYIDKNGKIILCRVLYDSTSQYGLQIISSGAVDSISLGGTTTKGRISSYNNAIDELNMGAQEYMNTSLSNKARSVGGNPTSSKDNVGYRKFSEERFEWVSEIGNFKDIDENYQKDVEQMNKLGITSTGGTYWLASRVAYYYENRNNSLSFGIRKIWSDGTVSETMICSIGKNLLEAGGTIESLSIRAVFDIKSDVVIMEGNGTEELPYIIGK